MEGRGTPLETQPAGARARGDEGGGRPPAGRARHAWWAFYRTEADALDAVGLSPQLRELCEHPFVSIKGGSYSQFRRALETGNLTLVRAAAAELPTITLDDALSICALYRADPSRYEAAVIRWLGRLCLERAGTTITDLRLALAAFDRLPEAPEEAEAELRRLVRR